MLTRKECMEQCKGVYLFHGDDDDDNKKKLGAKELAQGPTDMRLICRGQAQPDNFPITGAEAQPLSHTLPTA